MKYLAFLLMFLVINSARAQTIIHKDPEIAAMASQVSADSLREYIAKLVSFGTRHTLSTQSDPNKGIGAAQNYVLQKFRQFAARSEGRLSAYIDTITYVADQKRVNRDFTLGNVMAVLKGTDPTDERVLIISGHLDSRATEIMDSTSSAPGANDDGSGTAAVMECARIMSRHSFPATIIFVAVSGEEQGLLGSTYLAEKARKEGWNIVAVLNNDIIGNNNSNETRIIDNTRLRVFSEGIPHYEAEKQIRKIMSMGLENDGSSRQLARYVKETGERYIDNLEVVLEYRSDRFLRGGDHLPFLRNGFASVRLTEMNENYTQQHQDVREENGISYGDLTEHIDFEYLRKNTAVNLATLANLAKSPGAPQGVTVEVKQLTNSTLLIWEQPKRKPAGYYLLMRPTASSMWQKKYFTTETSIRLPYSKDNYFFAVQSTTETGNESLPVVPEVGR